VVLSKNSQEGGKRSAPSLVYLISREDSGGALRLPPSRLFIVCEHFQLAGKKIEKISKT
jgi:hypothetical protein